MLNFKSWCHVVDELVGDRNRKCVISPEPGYTTVGVESTANIVPSHYISEERIAHILSCLGKNKAAHFIDTKLPMSKNIRSGDLGEIYATEWIKECARGYFVPIKRLRWKDHREMAMRGEDVIGIYLDPICNSLHFLKTEAKSRANLTKRVIQEAQKGLNKDDGRPSAHALAFISDRLYESNNSNIANAIDQAMSLESIPLDNVKHLLFTLSGNSPDKLLSTALKEYKGLVPQINVGVYIKGHGQFIYDVYEQVIFNANNT